MRLSVGAGASLAVAASSAFNLSGLAFVAIVVIPVWLVCRAAVLINLPVAVIVYAIPTCFWRRRSAIAAGIFNAFVNLAITVVVNAIANFCGRISWRCIAYCACA